MTPTSSGGVGYCSQKNTHVYEGYCQNMKLFIKNKKGIEEVIITGFMIIQMI